MSHLPFVQCVREVSFNEQTLFQIFRPQTNLLWTRLSRTGQNPVTKTTAQQKRILHMLRVTARPAAVARSALSGSATAAHPVANWLHLALQQSGGLDLHQLTLNQHQESPVSELFCVALVEAAFMRVRTRSAQTFSLHENVLLYKLEQPVSATFTEAAMCLDQSLSLLVWLTLKALACIDRLVYFNKKYCSHASETCIFAL